MSWPTPPDLTPAILDEMSPAVRHYHLALAKCLRDVIREAERQTSAIRNQYERPAGVMPIPQVAFADLGTTKWREGGAPGLVYVADATSGEALAIRTGTDWLVAYLTPP